MRVASAPSARWWGGSTVLGEHIYVAGGLIGDGFSDTREFSRYSMVTDTWETLADIPQDLAQAPLVALDGLIYLVGGMVEAGNQPLFPVSSLRSYDPSTGEWTTLPPLPIPVGSGGAATDGARIYVVGGRTTPNQPVTETLIFDPSSMAWSVGAGLPTDRTGHSVVALDGRIYAVGGSVNGELSPTVDVYDPTADSWTQRTPMPSLRSRFTVAIMQGRLHAVGGRLPTAGAIVARHDAYDPVTDSWTRLADLPEPRNLPVGGGNQVNIWVIGGNDGTNGRSTVSMFSRESRPSSEQHVPHR